MKIKYRQVYLLISACSVGVLSTLDASEALLFGTSSPAVTASQNTIKSPPQVNSGRISRLFKRDSGSQAIKKARKFRDAAAAGKTHSGTRSAIESYQSRLTSQINTLESKTGRSSTENKVLRDLTSARAELNAAQATLPAQSKPLTSSPQEAVTPQQKYFKTVTEARELRQKLLTIANLPSKQKMQRKGDVLALKKALDENLAARTALSRENSTLNLFNPQTDITQNLSAIKAPRDPIYRLYDDLGINYDKPKFEGTVRQAELKNTLQPGRETVVP